MEYKNKPQNFINDVNVIGIINMLTTLKNKMFIYHCLFEFL